MTRPVVTMASHATRASGSLARIASRIASEIWSASLSGWPSVTDSDVKRDGMRSSFESPAPARRGHRVARTPSARVIPLGRPDRSKLTQSEIVDPRVAEELRATLVEELGHRRPRRLHHRFEVLALHLPCRRGGGDRTEDHDPAPLPQSLVITEHLVVKGELESPGQELAEPGGRLLALPASHEADGEDLARAVVDRDVQGRVLD